MKCQNEGDCRYMHNGLEVVAAELAHYQKEYYTLRERYIALYLLSLNSGWQHGYKPGRTSENRRT